MSIPAYAALRSFHALDKGDDGLRLFRGERRGSGALFSPCGRWRYLLWRVWDEALPLWSFGMLNPSTADHEKLDPTVKRCQSRAQTGGAGGFVVWNLFAWRDTEPAAMKQAADPVGPANDLAIRCAVEASATNIAAWGVHGTHREREHKVRAMLGSEGFPLHALDFTKDGHPRHPLYLPSALQPLPWDYVTPELTGDDRV